MVGLNIKAICVSASVVSSTVSCNKAARRISWPVVKDISIVATLIGW